ncbi:MAG: PAS domain S-box protein [Gemmatimonadales bacterium]
MAPPTAAAEWTSAGTFPADALVSLVPGVVTIHDPETGGCAFLGPGAEELFGIPLDELLARGARAIHERIDAADRDRVHQWYRAALAAGSDAGPTQFEYRFLHPVTGLKWLRTTGRLLPPLAGQPHRVLGVHVETTPAHEAEAAARTSQAELERTTSDYRRLLETTSEGIAVLDADRRIRYATRRMVEMVGYSAEEVIGQEAIGFLAPEFRELVVSRRKHQEAGVPERFAVAVLCRDGSRRWCTVASSPILEDGRFAGVLLMFTDTTAERAAAERLRESEERFRQFADSVDPVVWITSPSFDEILFLNRQFEPVTGITAADFVADPSLILRHIDPDDRALVDAAVLRIREGRHTVVDLRFCRPDGDLRWIHCRVFPIPGEDGSLQYIGGLCEDVTRERLIEAAAERLTHRLEDQVRTRTAELARLVQHLEAEAAERRATETALRESRQMLLDSEAIGQTGSWSFCLTSRRSAWSDGMYRLFGLDADGYDPAERGGWPFILEEDRRSVRAALDRGLATGSYQFECRIRRPDGRLRSLFCRGELRFGGTPAARLVGSMIDITELREAAAALEVERSRLRQIIDMSASQIAVTDRSGRIILANTACAAYVGLEPNDLVGRSYAAFCRDEDTFLARLAEDLAVLDSGLDLNVGDRMVPGVRGDRLLDVTKQPLFGAGGRPEHVVYGARDVTEERRAARLLQETEKHATVGRMAARVAHEINNPLAGIRNAIRLIGTAVPPDHRYAHYVDRVRRETDRIADVVRQMYDLYRPPTHAPSPCGPGAVVGDVLALLERKVADRAVTVRCTRAGAETVAVAEHLLRPVVMNLIQNSVEAVDRGGTVEVDTLVTPDRLVLTVADDGPGIPAEARDRILEPFFTTKSGVDGAGLGLGLATVNSVVSALGGRLEFGNRPSGGAWFQVAIPVPPQPSPEREAAPK